MVKLIRLASRNDCIFEANFDNNIIIEPNSQIAVLSATFKSPFKTITVREEDKIIRFIGDVNPANSAPLTSHTAFLTPKTYPSGIGGWTAFIKNLSNTLNATLNSQFSSTVGTGTPNFNGKVSNDVFGEFKIGPLLTDGFGNIVIPEEFQFFFAYAPLLTPMGPTAPGGYHGGNGTRNSALWGANPNLTQNIALNHLNMANGVARTTGTEHNLLPETQFGGGMCMGSGLYMARVRDFNNNGLGPALNNGFAIGLTSSSLGEPGVAIDNNQRQHEIIFNREGSPYEYRKNYVGRQISTFNAAKCSFTTYPEAKDHDVLWFRIGGDADPTSANYGKHVLTAGVWQEPGGVPTEQILFTHVISDEEHYFGYYPYIYINGAETEVVVDAICYTLSPFTYWDFDDQLQIDWKNPFADGYTTPGQPDDEPNDYRILTATTPQDVGSGSMGIFTPKVIFDKWSNTGLTFTSQLELSNSLLETLGFRTEQYSRATDPRYGVIEKKIGNDALQYINMLDYVSRDIIKLDDDDDFMVLIENIPVDSYDSSKQNYNFLPAQEDAATSGRRKNILMTIPVSEIAEKGGLVQFATNTPIFIDILNANKLNIRNLSLKIVNKDFTDVKTLFNDMSILTILIKSGGRD